MWFSTFDPAFRAFATSVFCNVAAPAAGGAVIYNAFSIGTPPTVPHWTPGFVMFENAGNTARTNAVVWGGWAGPRPVMWLSYAGGEVPS
jgi:hypothetical protein